MGQVWAEMARHISDSLIIPFKVSDYAVVMDGMAKTLLKDFGKLLNNNGIHTGIILTKYKLVACCIFVILNSEYLYVILNSDINV